MPVIPAKKGDVNDLFFRVFLLWLNPENPRIDRRMMRHIVAHIEVAGMQAFPDQIKPTVQRTKAALDAPPSGIQIPGDLDAALSRGLMAGACLYSTLRLAVYHEEAASLENGIRVAALALKKAGFASGRSTLLAAWKSHRPVCHFWAAVIHESSIFKTMARALPSRLSRKDVGAVTNTLPFNAAIFQAWMKEPARLVGGVKTAQEKLIPRFLALAERMRELGEDHYAPDQRARGHKLLPPGTAWEIPPAFSLPQVKVTFPKLKAEEKKALKTGRK